MFKAKCAFCGRSTVPYAMIGDMAIGPKCAARAGLLKGKLPKGSSVRFVKNGRSSKKETGKTIDLFESLAEQENQEMEKNGNN